MRVLIPSLALSAVSVSLLLSGCPRGGTTGEGEGEGEGEPAGDGNCPAVASGISVCQLQDPAAAGHPVTGEAVVVEHAIATSAEFVIDRDNTTNEPRRLGVFVSDDPVDTRGGVLVTYEPTTTHPTTIAIGDVLKVTGTADEFALQAAGSETRVSATNIEAVGGNTPLSPLVLTDASVLADESTGEDFEGVLVQIDNVAVESIGQFGQFTVTGGVVLDDTLFKYTALAGETFTSITGVVGYNVFTGGGFRLLPRQASDVVSASRPSNTVTQLNDGTVRRCNFDQFDCPVAVTAVVVSPTIFLGTDTERGAKFGFWVADPANVDANGRLGPNSGILVTVSPDNTREPVTTTYTFDQDADHNFTPGAAPEPGDVVEIFGQNAANFDQSELRFTSTLNKTTTQAAPLPALFSGAGADSTTGAHDAAELKGGRPDFADGDFTTGFDPPLEGVAAASDIEKWEGVLVELKDVTMVESCYATPFKPMTGAAFARDFGNFLVTGNVEIGDRFDTGFGGFFLNTIDATQRTCANLANACENSRADGQTFASIKGIVDYSFNVHRVNPLSQGDIASTPAAVAAGTGRCQ